MVTRNNSNLISLLTDRSVCAALILYRGTAGGGERYFVTDVSLDMFSGEVLSIASNYE